MVQAAAGTRTYAHQGERSLDHQASVDASYAERGALKTQKAVDRKLALAAEPAAETNGTWPFAISPMDALLRLCSPTRDTSRVSVSGKKDVAPLYFYQCDLCEGQAISGHNLQGHHCPRMEEITDVGHPEDSLIVPADVVDHLFHGGADFLEAVRENSAVVVHEAHQFLTPADYHAFSFSGPLTSPVFTLATTNSTSTASASTSTSTTPALSPATILHARYQALMALARHSHNPAPPAPGLPNLQDTRYPSLKYKLDGDFLSAIAGGPGEVIQTYCVVEGCLAGTTTRLFLRDNSASSTHKCAGKNGKKTSVYARICQVGEFADLPLHMKERILHAIFYTIDPFHQHIGDDFDAVIGFTQSP